jgi:hypothetical protein
LPWLIDPPKALFLIETRKEKGWFEAFSASNQPIF